MPGKANANANQLKDGGVNDDDNRIFSNAQTLLVNNRYKVGNYISSGNFGELHFGKDTSTGEIVAIKIELANSSQRQLYIENKHYRTLNGKDNSHIRTFIKKKIEPGVCKMLYYGSVGKYFVLVITLLGPCLEELFNLCNRKFSTKTVAQIGIQTINLIKIIHDFGIIYRDIKPENFLIGRRTNENSTVYIVDFGLSKEYIDSHTKKHIPYRENKSLTGTARYMSINTHMGKEQSRRDDLESLGHMFFYFLRGVLPWQGLKAENLKERYQKIGQVKRSTPIETLCEGLHTNFGEYLRLSRQLDFYEDPNYNKFLELFSCVLEDIGADCDNIMDWNMHPNFRIKPVAEDQFEASSGAGGGGQSEYAGRNALEVKKRSNAKKDKKRKNSNEDKKQDSMLPNDGTFVHSQKEQNNKPPKKTSKLKKLLVLFKKK